MNKERDLLPWILGGLSVATIAVAFAAVSSHREAATLAPTALAPPQPAAPQPLQPTVSAPAAPAPSTAQPPPVRAAVLDSAPSSSLAAPAGQIWECTTNGVKTFSNNPCGEKSTLLKVSTINTMRATPAIPYARAYTPEPRYAPAYPDQAASGDEEVGGDSYTIVQGVGLTAHRRPEHSHRPPPHHNSAHNSGSMQR